MSRWQKAKSKVENTTTLLRLLVVAGSGYLLWKRFKQEEQSEVIEQQAVAQGGSPGATTPLVGAQAQVLPNAGGEHQVAYQGMTPEQQETASKLQTAPVDDLTPGGSDDVASLITRAEGWLTSALES